MTALDQIDVQLLRLLRQDASVSHSELAQRLYLSPRTVRSRIQRLREAGVIRFTVCINREKAGYPATADIMLQVEANRVARVAEQIAQFPEVGYIAITTGSHDISIQVYGHSTDDIHRFVVEKLALVPGVIRTNVFVLFKIMQECAWAPPLDCANGTRRKRGRRPRLAG
jgi:DNA-binding Lrp family transcriptional regulator